MDEGTVPASEEILTWNCKSQTVKWPNYHDCLKA